VLLEKQSNGLSRALRLLLAAATAAGLVCQVYKLGLIQQQQHPQWLVPPVVVRRLPQRQRLLGSTTTQAEAA
jgi:hypothetical protein